MAHGTHRLVRTDGLGRLYIKHDGHVCLLDQSRLLAATPTRVLGELRAGEVVVLVDASSGRGGCLARTLWRGHEVYWVSPGLA